MFGFLLLLLAAVDALPTGGLDDGLVEPLREAQVKQKLEKLESPSRVGSWMHEGRQGDHGLAAARAAWEERHHRQFPGRELGRELDCASEYDGRTLVTEYRREWADRHLGPRGAISGIEVGACGMPVKMPANVNTTYVDQDLGAASTQCEVGESQHQVTDDANTLSKFADQSLDFVIGNHVLEHTTNFLGAVEHWVRVVRPGGLVMVALPDPCDPMWDTGESLRLAANPEHYVKEYRHPDPPYYHLAEGGVFLHGIGKTKRAWRDGLSANGLHLADVDPRVNDGEGLRRILEKEGKGPLVTHQHVWTKQTLREALEAAQTLFPADHQFEFEEFEIADNLSAHWGEMREFRVVLRRLVPGASPAKRRTSHKYSAS